MANSELGAVVFGTGFGVLTHLRALRKAGFEVLALVGRDPEKTRKRAQMLDVPHGLTSATEALALPGVDAVAVATPPHSHAAIVLEAIAAGKHVLCEKPFARDASEGRQLLEAAEKAGIVHLLGTEFRWSTAQALMNRAVHDGLIGEPRMGTFLFQMPALADPAAEVPSWWGDAEQGGGWLGAYGSHVIDQARTLLGEFEGVSASLHLVSDRHWTADDSYTVHFRTRDGAEGILQSSAGTWGAMVICCRVVGTRGTVWIQGAEVFVADSSGERKLDVPEDLRLPAPEPPPSELLVTAYDGLHSMGIDLAPYTRLFETMRDRIHGRTIPDDPTPATFADGVAIQTVLDAVRRSSNERNWITID